MEYVSQSLASALWATLLLGAILLISARLGGLCLYALGLRPEDLSAGEKAVFSAAGGLIVLALGVLGIGLAGFLERIPVLLLLGAAAGLPFLFKRKNIFSMPSPERLRTIRINPVYFLLLIPLGLSFLQCFTPPIANDALAYHLAIPKQFILNHRMTYLPFSRESLWPSQTEMLFTLSLLLQGTSLAQLFHWIFFGMTAGAVYLYARRFYGASAAFAAVFIFSFTPVVFAESSQAYNDLSLAFYIFAAFYFLMLADEKKNVPMALVSGLLCGGALATKYLALAPCGILLILWVTCFAHRWKVPAAFLAGCAATSGIWYIRSWLLLGNPVYPFFRHIFGSGYPVNYLDYTWSGMGAGWVSGGMLLWNITLHPDRFGGELMGPLYLMCLPLLLFSVHKAGKREWFTIFFVACYAFYIFRQAQLIRYFLSELPLLAIGAGAAAGCFGQSKWIRRTAWAIFSGALFLHTTLFFYRTRDTWSFLLGKESVDSYLVRTERSYEGYRYLNNHTKLKSRVFNAAEARSFYKGDYDMVSDGIALRIELTGKNKSVEEYLDGERFEYIWLGNDPDPALSRYVNERGYQEVQSYRFTEKPAQYVYNLYRAPTS